ncbi:MAG: DUF3631 domain-containing protein [Terriglobales bacterium]
MTIQDWIQNAETQGAKRRSAADLAAAVELLAAVADAPQRDRYLRHIAALGIPGGKASALRGRLDAALAERTAQQRQAADAEHRAKLAALHVDGARLLRNISHAIRRYMALAAALADILALWTIHTWAIDAAQFTPYLHITSPEKRCAKSRLLEILELLVARPWATAHLTPAVLYRRTEGERPTLLLDELDQQMHGNPEANAAIRGILNAGFRRGKVVSICEKSGDGAIGYRDYATFCPKALAGIGALWDTVADRSLTITLRRKLRGEHVLPFRERDAAWLFTPLRTACEAWAAQHLDALGSARPPMPEPLNDRQRDICEPLLGIADAAGGEWPSRARQALVEICTGAAAVDDSTGAKLLADCRAILGGLGTDRIASEALARTLGALEDRPWPEWGRSQKPITPPQVAHLLANFAIAPRTLRLPSGDRLKGYLRADFADAWARYLPPETGVQSVLEADPPAPKRDSVTSRASIEQNPDFAAVTPEACHAPENALLPNNGGPCHGVTARGTVEAPGTPKRRLPILAVADIPHPEQAWTR